MRIGSIVIHCHEFDRMVAFWGAALGYVPRPPDFVVLEDPDGNLFCVVSKPETAAT